MEISLGRRVTGFFTIHFLRITDKGIKIEKRSNYVIFPFVKVKNYVICRLCNLKNIQRKKKHSEFVSTLIFFKQPVYKQLALGT